MAQDVTPDQDVAIVVGNTEVSTASPFPVSVVSSSGAAPTAATATHTADQTVTTPASTILAANTARKAAVIQCVSGGNVRVALDGSAPTASKGIQLVAGASPLIIEGTSNYGCPTAAIKAIREGSSDGVVSVTELA